MSEVKRFDGKIKHVGDGGYVSYKDYAELKAQRDVLAAENAALKLAIETHKHGFMRCECCGEENMCHNDDVCRALDETPATDAYLNSVRDSFVDEAIHALAASGAQSFGDCMVALNQLRAGEPS